MGATRRMTSLAGRTSSDKWPTIIPGREPIRTTLNAMQVTTDQKAGGSNPSERARSEGLSSSSQALTPYSLGRD
jgi:hypothetical protein